MAKECGTLIGCLRKTAHHAETGEVLVQLSNVITLSTESFSYRFELIRQNMQSAIAQLRKIQEAADKDNLADIKRLLAEKTLEFGHDLQILAKETGAD